MTSAVQRQFFDPSCCCCTILLQCAKFPIASSWECNLHSPEFLLSVFQIKGHAPQLLSCLTISLATLNSSILLSFMKKKNINHIDKKLALIKRRHHTVDKNPPTMLWNNLLQTFLFFNISKITLYTCFSRVFIIGCLPAAFSAFLPACQKGLLKVRKHENYLKTAKRRPERACFWTTPNALSWIAAHLLIEWCLMFVLCLKICCPGELCETLFCRAGVCLGNGDRLPSLLFTSGLSLERRYSVHQLSHRSFRSSVCCPLALIIPGFQDILMQK